MHTNTHIHTGSTYTHTKYFEYICINQHGSFLKILCDWTHPRENSLILFSPL